MLKTYLKIAWRNIYKNKVYATINIGGLALGMAVALIIGLWIHDEMTYDDYFKNRKKIGQILQTMTFNGETGTTHAVPRPLEAVFRNDYKDNFKHIVMASWQTSQYLQYEDVTISKGGYYMQKDAPELFELKIKEGKKNGLDDINSIMLAESTAKALFGEESPIGKIIKVNNEFDMEITAVYEDLPFKTTYNDMKFLMPWKKYVAINKWIQNAVDEWGNNSFQMLVQIADNADMIAVGKKIRDAKKERSEDTRAYNPQLVLLPMNDWHLRSDFENGVQTSGGMKMIWLFGAIGAIVLLLACINFMNLSTAKSEKRAKEVGVLKSIGSNRLQLVNQFLGESFLVVLFAYVIAILIVLTSLSGFNVLASKEISFPWEEPVFWIISVVFIAFTTFLAGSYPAIYLSSFKPAQALKGTFKAKNKIANAPRKVLVVVQFTVSVAFIIGTVVIMQQMKHAQNRPIGYDKEGLVQLPVMSAEFLGKADLMRNEFIASGAVVEMSHSSSPINQIWSNWNGFSWEGKPKDFQEDFAVTHISPEYAESLGLKIVEGRDFSREFASDSLAVVINQSAVKYMGLDNPIGKYIENTDNFDEKLKIIGVIEDIVAVSPYEPVKQALYFYGDGNQASYYNLRLNPNKSAAHNLSVIEKVFKEHFPNIPFKYDFVDEVYGKKFRGIQRMGTLVAIFTGLAILISCLGLFALTSYVVEQRTKEIGVRKVLGASILSVWNLLTKDFLKLVTISCLIAIPVAYSLMSNWLENYTYRINLEWWVFGLAIIGALIITVLTVSFQAIKAAIANPVKSLRSE